MNLTKYLPNNGFKSVHNCWNIRHFNEVIDQLCSMSDSLRWDGFTIWPRLIHSFILHGKKMIVNLRFTTPPLFFLHPCLVKAPLFRNISNPLLNIKPSSYKKFQVTPVSTPHFLTALSYYSTLNWEKCIEFQCITLFHIAQNYRFVAQEAIQGYHSNNKTTLLLFPIHFKDALTF